MLTPTTVTRLRNTCVCISLILTSYLCAQHPFHSEYILHEDLYMSAAFGAASGVIADQVGKLIVNTIDEQLLTVVAQNAQIYGMSEESAADIRAISQELRAHGDLSQEEALIPIEATQESVATLQERNPHHIYVVQDATHTMLNPNAHAQSFPSCIMVSPAFLGLSYAQKRAHILHELSHVRNKDATRTTRMYHTLSGTLFAPCGYIMLAQLYRMWRDDMWWRSLGYACIPHILINYTLRLAIWWCMHQISQYHEIRSDIDTQGDFQAYYDGLRLLSPEAYLPDDIESYTLKNKVMTYLSAGLQYLQDPHQHRSIRYAYMQHYHEHGDLPRSIKLRPAYWLGKHVDMITRPRSLAHA